MKTRIRKLKMENWASKVEIKNSNWWLKLKENWKLKLKIGIENWNRKLKLEIKIENSNRNLKLKSEIEIWNWKPK